MSGNQNPNGDVTLTLTEQSELGINDLLRLRKLPAIDTDNIGVQRLQAWFRGSSGKPEYRAESALRTSWLLAKAAGLNPAPYGTEDEEQFRNVLALSNLQTLKDNQIPQQMVCAIMDRHLAFGDVWSNIRTYTPAQDPTTTRLYVEAAEESNFEMDLVGMAYSSLMLRHHPQFVPSAEINVGCKIDN